MTTEEIIALSEDYEFAEALETTLRLAKEKCFRTNRLKLVVDTKSESEVKGDEG